jgi:DNA-binding response OmpR family regulator
MMDQSILNQQNVVGFARAIARELLRELVPSLSLDAITQSIQQNEVCQIGPLTIDRPRHEATLNGELLVLKPREFALLAFFAHNPGRVFSRSQLIELVWPDDIAGAIDSDRTVDVHIRRIRVQLGDAARLIQTIAGVGYKLQTATAGS